MHKNEPASLDPQRKPDADSGSPTRQHTVHDVARMAGVSTATVNRVLQDKGYVAESTKLRVTETLKATGYRPSAVARGLRARRSFTIGHILTAITINPFFVKVARSVEEEALKHGYKTFLFNHNGDRERETLGIERFIDRRVDAIIFTNALATDNVRAALDAGIPVVQVERVTGVATSAVMVDNAVGATEAMQHLLDLGHQRIAFIGGDPALLSAGTPDAATIEVDRLAAYTDRIEAVGLTVAPELVRLGPYYDSEGSGRYGYRHMQSLLALKDRPTAVFATCDILAAGVLQALYEHKLRVPDDISIVGYDDTLAANLTPPLTTVAQPMDELGQHAFRLALEAIEGAAHPTTVTLQTFLRLRGSTGHPHDR